MTEGAKRCAWNENVVSSTPTGANLGNQSSYEALEDPRVEIAATDYNWHRENDAVHSREKKQTYSWGSQVNDQKMYIWQCPLPPVIYSVGRFCCYIEDPLSSKRQFLTIDRSLKMMKNAFYFILIALFVLEIFTVLT